MTDDRKKFEDELGYFFADPRLLESALTHASAAQPGGNNERLEFLGDRVLGLAVADFLYGAYPAEREGDLAKRHAALVAKAALAQVAADINLAPHIRISHGESKTGGSKKDTILADGVEALIGAIYLDGGFKAARAFVHERWQNLVDAYGAPPEDSKSALQVWAQQRGLPLPEYKLLSRTGPDHAPVFEIEVAIKGFAPATAAAASKQAAEKDAAQQMLNQIKEVK